MAASMPESFRLATGFGRQGVIEKENNTALHEKIKAPLNPKSSQLCL